MVSSKCQRLDRPVRPSVEASVASFCSASRCQLELAQQKPGERAGHGDQRRDQEADGPGVLPPLRVDVGGRLADADEDRQIADLAVGEQAVHAVGHGDGLEPAGAGLFRLPEHLRVLDALADDRFVERPAHQERAVGPRQRDVAVRAERHILEQLLEVGELHRAGDDAGERSVRVRQPLADTDEEGAGLPRGLRLADIEYRRFLGLVNPEIVAVAHVGGLHDRVARVVAQTPGLIEHQDRAEMARGRRMIEQHQLAQVGADAADLRMLQVVDHTLQRKVERLDVADDVGFDGRDHARGGVAGALERGAPRLDQDVRAHRAKAQRHKDDRSQNLEPVRMRLRPDARDVVIKHAVPLPRGDNAHRPCVRC
jgi:hypothetical protein